MPASLFVVTGNDLVAGAARDRVLQFLKQQSVYHYTQHPDWACADNPHDFVGVGTTCSDDLVAWTLVRRRRLPIVRLSKYFGGRGPVVADLRVLPQHLTDLSRVLSTDGLYLTLHPYNFGELSGQYETKMLSAGFANSPHPQQFYRDTLTIDLTLPIEVIRARFRKSVKHRINQSSSLGISVIEVVGEESRQRFALDYAAAMRSKSVGIPANFMALLSQFATPPNGYLLQALWSGEPVAGIALVSAGSNIIYEWGYTSPLPEHRRLSLQHALQWHAVQLAKEAGYTCYDWGGYWAELGNDNPINSFKLGFTHEQSNGVEAMTIFWRRRLARMFTRSAVG